MCVEDGFRSCVLQDDERGRVRDAFEKNRFNI